MADMMQSAASFLADELADNLSQTVTYRRGGSPSRAVSVTATKCPIRSESDEFNIDSEPCDWIIKASLLTLNSETFEPATPDVIVESDGQEWLVAPRGNEPEFRPSDPFRTMFRVRTRRIKEPT